MSEAGRQARLPIRRAARRLRWLAPLAGLFGVASAAAVLLPVAGRAAARRGRACRTAAANRAWLRDHGFQSASQGLSSRALRRRV